MDLIDFFFPEQSQAAQLRRLADTHERTAVEAVSGNIAVENLQRSVEELERENRDLSLCLKAIVKLLLVKGLVQADELQTQMISLLPPEEPYVAIRQ